MSSLTQKIQAAQQNIFEKHGVRVIKLSNVVLNLDEIPCERNGTAMNNRTGIFEQQLSARQKRKRDYDSSSDTQISDISYDGFPINKNKFNEFVDDEGYVIGSKPGPKSSKKRVRLQLNRRRSGSEGGTANPEVNGGECLIV